ncbi:MAG: prepilin-type N-terminal cleavage/methylation domain-containing protein [Actinomycetota bacterium]|nr:prepilin-type N-terminal cleavage/methylation domain-containing protein [Actinomycetota bacterium]
MRRESGFTLIEILVALAMSAILLTLGAAALRHYWMLHSLEGARGSLISELRKLQQQTVAESHPLIYGAWFREGPGAASNWGILKFNPKDTSTAADDTCAQIGPVRSFSGQVYVESANFEVGPDETSICSTAAPSGSDLVFFYARGSATAGSIVLRQDAVGRATGVSVSGITGRVEEQ